MLIRTKKGVLKEIIYDQKQLYNYGINRLSSRDYSRHELLTKMKRLQPDLSMVNTALDKLEEQGYLSDKNRVRSLLNQFDSRESINKTKNRILQKGVNKYLIEDMIEEKQSLDAAWGQTQSYDEDELSKEVSNAQDLLVKKFRFYDIEKKDKMVRFLASKGYKYPDISKAVKSFSTLSND
jgi:SOS response regulatory protein OraA/RecX